jgi:RNA polymerase sigma-70 factor (ECF subfamily)
MLGRANVDAEGFVERAKKGDAVALERVLAEIAPAVRRFGMRMCKNPDDADDVLQDTLLTIATHLPEFEGRASLQSWVFALTRSACARKRRGLKNQPPVPDVERVDEAPSPEARAANREIGAALTRALDDLPEEQREVVLLRDVEGLSGPEAAAAIGITVDALKSRLHRARSALRVSLTPLLESPSTCPDVAMQWSRKLEGDLSTVDCALMEKHVTTCPTCAAACDALKDALLACRRSAGQPVPPEVQARVKAAVSAWSVARGVQ